MDGLQNPINSIIRIFKENGYRLNTRPYEINLVGMRSKSTIANRFDDELLLFYKNGEGQWATMKMPCTTDPGTYYLQNPVFKGTAILAAGQYQDAYQIGLHKGKYKALVQRGGPVTIVRDYNRNTIIDFGGTTVTGYFGINIHRAREKGVSVFVDKHSAGCTVVADSSEFDLLMSAAERHKKLYGNRFTYTLIDWRELEREQIKKAGLSILAFTGIIALIRSFVKFNSTASV